MLTVSYPVLALPNICPCFLVVVGIDRDLAMVMNPKIVVGPWSRVQNCEPVEAILQARISVGPGLVSFAPYIAIETGWPRLAVSKGSKTRLQANPVLLWQCVRRTNNNSIGVLRRRNLKHMIIRVGR